ncbi:MAG: BrnT family toxin [Patescibacteria group bacterium]|nr:BrnT family toxin [Patescibacteria group bacterium]MCL5431947.1 BrnT family toxin [Patescibacteria group bacterium]
MKYYDWNEEKNQKLKTERDISLEEIINAIESNGLLDEIENPHKEKYKSQKMYVVEIDNYIYLVPFVEYEEKIFLKTIFPSRKATKKYLIEK